ncbi:hypothetical protein FRC01_007109, partial [Tulasnella sp. 417]
MPTSDVVKGMEDGIKTGTLSSSLPAMPESRRRSGTGLEAEPSAGPCTPAASM